jgi:branched-chain amino acid transport system substrate-binding protein
MTGAYWRAIVLALAVSFVVFGCGEKQPSGGARPGGEGASTASQLEETKAADTAKAPKDAIAVKVGVVLPRTGAIATYGDMCDKAIRLAAEDARAEGKVWPELIIVDNGAEAQKTVSAVKKFVDVDKVSVIVGPVTSNNAIAAGDHAEAGGVPLVTPTATNVQVTVNRKYVFRVCFTDDLQGKAAADFAYDTLKARRVGMLIDSSQSYSTGLGDAFSTSFKQRGGEITSQLSFDSNSDDFGGQVTQMKLKKPDVIFMPAYYEPVAKCISQARAAGLRSTFLGTDGWDSKKLYELAGGSVKGNYFTTHFSPLEDRPIVKRFVQNFRAAYGDEPDALAALGYDAAAVVFDAVRRAGSADREAITNALAATRDFEGVTGKFSIDDRHNTVKSVVILETGDKASTIKAVVTPR